MRSFRDAGSSIVFLALAVGALGACSSSSGAANNDASTDTPATDGQAIDGPLSPANMTLTSTALTNGAMFMTDNTCAGVNTSPPLTWTAGPTGTMSYAVVLSDTANMAAHWVIWDIPSSVMTLPANLPGDTTLTTPVSAKQLHKFEFFGAGGAYRGPCPAGATHTYVFEVTAIPTATLAVGASPTTELLRAQIELVGLGHGDLSGTSNATAPPTDAGTDSVTDAGGQ